MLDKHFEVRTLWANIIHPTHGPNCPHRHPANKRVKCQDTDFARDLLFQTLHQHIMALMSVLVLLRTSNIQQIGPAKKIHMNTANMVHKMFSQLCKHLGTRNEMRLDAKGNSGRLFGLNDRSPRGCAAEVQIIKVFGESSAMHKSTAVIFDASFRVAFHCWI